MNEICSGEWPPQDCPISRLQDLRKHQRQVDLTATCRLLILGTGGRDHKFFESMVGIDGGNRRLLRQFRQIRNTAATYVLVHVDKLVRVEQSQAEIGQCRAGVGIGSGTAR